jgi:hypothetical protein
MSRVSNHQPEVIDEMNGYYIPSLEDWLHYQRYLDSLPQEDLPQPQPDEEAA